VNKHAPIPAWFDIEKYSGTSELTAYGWLDNLTIRELAYDFGIESFQAILDNPIVERNKIPSWFRHFRTVTNPSCGDICTSYEQVIMDAPSSYFEFKNHLDSSTLYVNSNQDSSRINSGGRELGSFLNKEFTINDEYFLGNELVKVNLQANDQQIIEDFKTWLKELRKKERLSSAPIKPFKENDYRDWAKFCVLPYIDLTIWANLNNCRFKNVDIGKALFPYSRSDIGDPTDCLRKSTKPKAEMLMDSLVLQAFNIQVRKEMNDTKLE
jgi:hypothetical protein